MHATTSSGNPAQVSQHGYTGAMAGDAISGNRVTGHGTHQPSVPAYPTPPLHAVPPTGSVPASNAPPQWFWPQTSLPLPPSGHFPSTGMCWPPNWGNSWNNLYNYPPPLWGALPQLRVLIPQAELSRVIALELALELRGIQQKRKLPVNPKLKIKIVLVPV